MLMAPEKCNIYAKFCNERDPWLQYLRWKLGEKGSAAVLDKVQHIHVECSHTAGSMWDRWLTKHLLTCVHTVSVTWCFMPSQPVRLYLGHTHFEEACWHYNHNKQSPFHFHCEPTPCMQSLKRLTYSAVLEKMPPWSFRCVAKYTNFCPYPELMKPFLCDHDTFSRSL